jgi:limonene-1,2-epoxide hydrolase
MDPTSGETSTWSSALRFASMSSESVASIDLTQPVEPAEIGVVREFLAALERSDVEVALSLLDPEATYQNVPFPPARGRAAVEQQLRGLERWFSGFAVIHHTIAANGSIVLTERTDILSIGSIDVSIWVCGTFEVRNGRIVLWRDRFDFADLTWAFVRGGAKALLGLVRGGRG